MAHSEEKKLHRDSERQTVDRQKNMKALVSGIEQDANSESESLLGEARTEAQRRLLYAEKQAESILQEASEKAEEQVERIRSHLLSGVNIEAKRRFMHMQDEVYGEVVGRARDRLQGLMEKKEYPKVLLGLVVEAAIGIGMPPSARVNATEQERTLITGKLLDEAVKKVKALTGRSMELTISDEAPLRGQGIVLTSGDGRIAFNNQMETRLKRINSEIRKIIHEKLLYIQEQTSRKEENNHSRAQGAESEPNHRAG